MINYEPEYAKLVANILDNGEVRQTRNAETKAIFGTTLDIDMSNDYCNSSGYFPLLTGRKMFYKGILGEFAAMVRGPTKVADFEKYGCNYWKQWADKDGELKLDYGNAWLDFNGFDQIENLRYTLQENPTDRRLIVSGWRPDKLHELSLPCCHLMYQWYVRESRFLDMIWYQRSADTMVGIPSDVVLAAIWNIALAKDTGYRPGKIKMVFGDTHIYKQHYAMAETYLNNYYDMKEISRPSYLHNAIVGKHICRMLPEDFEIQYKAGPTLNLEVIS